MTNRKGHSIFYVKGVLELVLFSLLLGFRGCRRKCLGFRVSGLGVGVLASVFRARRLGYKDGKGN